MSSTLSYICIWKICITEERLKSLGHLTAAKGRVLSFLWLYLVAYLLPGPRFVVALLVYILSFHIQQSLPKMFLISLNLIRMYTYFLKCQTKSHQLHKTPLDQFNSHYLLGTVHKVEFISNVLKMFSLSIMYWHVTWRRFKGYKEIAPGWVLLKQTPS